MNYLQEEDIDQECVGLSTGWHTVSRELPDGTHEGVAVYVSNEYYGDYE